MGDLVIDDLNKLEPLGELTSNVPTPSFAEIVIRTAQLDTMKCWYQAVLGVAPFIDRRNPRPDGSTPSGGANRAADMQGVLFFDVRPEEPTTQILGSFGFWELRQCNADHNGIDHIKFYHRNLSELFDPVERLPELRGCCSTACTSPSITMTAAQPRLREAMQTERAEVVVDGEAHGQFQPVAQGETRAVREAERLVGVCGETGPGRFLVSGRDPLQSCKGAGAQLLPEAMRDRPAKAVADQGQGFVQHEVAGQQSAAIFAQGRDHGFVIRVPAIGQRRPDRPVPQHRPGGGHGRVTRSPMSPREAGRDGRPTCREPAFPTACPPPLYGLEDRASGQAVENATRPVRHLHPRQRGLAESRCPVLPGTPLRSIIAAPGQHPKPDLNEVFATRVQAHLCMGLDSLPECDSRVG